ncbi:hypothetical protein JSY14_09375 [Brachybacterium sp. EF45031]|uniref:hypothetical protein n=1 Tax=Brachybacterium sillae TaxID=2810536 RepID=UPI00217D9260|nr:hypothetical protein [Brachybacterium sillae]MCS6712219.1 hypothetical protein [Brachybacterium sillae]
MHRPTARVLSTAAAALLAVTALSPAAMAGGRPEAIATSQLQTASAAPTFLCQAYPYLPFICKRPTR